MEVVEPVCLPRLPRVVVCGGTHGNELSGVYLIRELLKEVQQKEIEDDGLLSVLMVLSNPWATQQCRRYVDTDLNRCFSHATLSGPVSDTDPYEIIWARELNAMLGPKGSPGAVDLVCDLHNTTANMGLCFIAYSDKDWICLHIFKHLQRQMPEMPMRFIHFDVSKKESYSLDSVGKHGFALEIGPQSHGVVRSNIYTAMKVGVQHMLDWIRHFNSGAVSEGGCVDVFTMVKNIDYPRDSQTHNITAAIHPHLQDGYWNECHLKRSPSTDINLELNMFNVDPQQENIVAGVTGAHIQPSLCEDRDFCLLHPEDPLFRTFSGEDLTYKGNEPLYPFFINECSYYEKGIALSLARKKRVMIPPIRARTEENQASERPRASEED